MGSWAELDARYAPGTPTPAVTFLVALAYMLDAASVYRSSDGTPASFVPAHGLGSSFDAGTLQRAEAYLQQTPVEQFLRAAPPLLNRDQKLCLLINVLDQALIAGIPAPAEQPLFQQFLEAFDIPPEQMQPHMHCLLIKNNLAIFPQ